MSSDPPAPTAQESTAAMLEAYRTGLPGLMATVNSQMLPNELAQLASAQAVSPAYSKLQADIYDTVGRQLNKTGTDIANQNQMNSAQNDLRVAQTVGGDLLKQSVENQRIADPEWYKNRALLGDSLSSMLGAGGNLTEGEMAQIERGNNRMNYNSGNSLGNSASIAARGAMQFGNASTNKFMQGLQMATQALPTLKSGMDANLIATGKLGTPNSGDSKFTGAKQSAGEGVQSYANNLLGQIGSVQNSAINANAQRRSGLDKSLGFATDMIGSVGSFFK